MLSSLQAYFFLHLASLKLCVFSICECLIFKIVQPLPVVLCLQTWLLIDGCITEFQSGLTIISLQGTDIHIFSMDIMCKNSQKWDCCPQNTLIIQFPMDIAFTCKKFIRRHCCHKILTYMINLLTTIYFLDYGMLS